MGEHGEAGPRRVEWYFDFVSPFAYLASQRLGAVAERARIVCRPVLFAGLLEHWGHRGPAEIAPKRVFTYRHALWLAGRAGIPMRLPERHPFNPLPYLRLSIALGDDPATVAAIFAFLWRQGLDAGQPATFEALCRELGVADGPARIGDQRVKDGLRRNTEQAIAAGVFGVPTFRHAGALFWGFDAVDFLLDCLADPALLDAPHMRAAAATPVGAARKP